MLPDPPGARDRHAPSGHLLVPSLHTLLARLLPADGSGTQCDGAAQLSRPASGTSRRQYPSDSGRGSVGTTTDHGVKIVLDNESKITDADITGCLATGLGRGFVEVNADIDDDGDDCSIGDLNISNNGTAANPLEAQSEVIQLRVAGTSDVTFHVDNNVMEDSANGHSQGNGI